MEMADGDMKGTVSDNRQLRKFWRLLWQLNILHKIHHFAWRACKDIIPTKENLVKRKMLLEGCYDACQLEVESSGHLFWECASVREVWAASNLFPTCLKVHFHSFMDMIWFGVLEAKWEQNRIEKIIMVAWVEWMNRNSVRNGGTKKSSQQLVCGALEYLPEYQEGVREVTEPSPRSPIHWSPPLLDKFKINVDGTVFASQKTARVGILIRDSEGRVVGACSKKIQAPFGAVKA